MNADTTPSSSYPVSPTVAEQLAMRWDSVEQFVKEGIPVRAGPFTKEEDDLLRDTLKHFEEEHNLTKEDVDRHIFGEVQDRTIWAFLAQECPGRRVCAVYHHVQRMLHPDGGKGLWSTAEDAVLNTLADMHSHDWGKIGKRLQRAPTDCRDRWHMCAENRREGQAKGRWSAEEEARLIEIMQDLCPSALGSGAQRLGSFWNQVSTRMGQTRGPRQCRNKWHDSLEPRTCNDGWVARWKKEDSVILVHKIAALGLDSKEAIPWASLSDESWAWNAHKLHQKWALLKGSMESEARISHQI
ncbi:hypothetical protein BC834DRAFT_970688 [Gloeopeniophorella convolvens]|nr:hypothetical protein BC834DRAFT_970688 [Gloeopeniophorella convolvens]